LFSKIWVAMFLVELIGYFTRSEFNNAWIYNLFRGPFYFYLAAFYFQILRSERIHVTIQIFYYCFILFFICNSIFFQGLFTFQTLTVVFGGCFITLLAIGYFLQLLNSPEHESITHDPYFWISFAFVVYFGATVPFLGMFNYLNRSFPAFHSFYFDNVYHFFSILLNIIITIAFLCRTGYRKLS
jgi:hypothetical protein